MSKSKGSREAHCSNEFRKDTRRKQRISINQWDVEKEKNTTLNAAKKLKNCTNVSVAKDKSISYRILNFNFVFTEISQFVKCKECGGDIKFYPESTRGLGFKIMLTCQLCKPRLIPSCPQIGLAFEINRRFTFAMRCIGQGPTGEKILRIDGFTASCRPKVA
ncbi:Uncharacterized protein DBV15_12981 [Temnothorax longispinosus]|uniref:Uncharacterized protein n=1 Tax=Temnothorax longispinosus TaxID=300112 RepID=A0A4S2KI14_9HYME|nr:Uncharacterized protein DBV15_12981 [Temnothorax longispinosus]